MAGTFEGLSVPLYGGYQQYTSGSTVAVTVTDIGATKHDITLEATPTNKLGTADWPSMYGGFMFKTATGASAYGMKFLSSVISVFDYNATDANLSAAGITVLEVDSSAVITGGRLAVHMFVADNSAAYITNRAAYSWLDFEETNTDYSVPTFLSFEIGTTDSCFSTEIEGNVGAAAAWLRCYINNTQYWLALHASCPD